jgi:hypothetical protein
MKESIMPISLGSSTFADMKRDWTNTIQEALAKAKELGVSKGSVTLKTEFNLDKMPVNSEKDYREADVPRFKWKVGYTVKLENSQDGEFGGEYELTQEEGSYGLRPLDGQTSMFDEDEDEMEDDDE